MTVASMWVAGRQWHRGQGGDNTGCDNGNGSEHHSNWFALGLSEGVQRLCFEGIAVNATASVHRDPGTGARDGEKQIAGLRSLLGAMSYSQRGGGAEGKGVGVLNP